MKRIIEINGKKYKAINESKNKEIIRRWQETWIDFVMGIRDIQQMFNKMGDRTSSRILDKAYKKVSPMIDKLEKLIVDLAEKY